MTTPGDHEPGADDLLELRLQPGVTPEYHAWPVEAIADARAYPGRPERLAQTAATALAATGPRAYVTEISVPEPGDGGVQRLHSHMLQPEPEPEAE